MHLLTPACPSLLIPAVHAGLFVAPPTRPQVLNSDLHRGPQLSVRALEVLNATLAAHPVALLAPPDANGFTVLRRNEQLLWLRPDTPLMVRSLEPGPLRVICR